MTLEKFNEMAFEDLVFRAEYIQQREAEERRDKMRAAAFTVWLQGPCKEVGFEKFVEPLHIAIKEERKLTKEQLQKAKMKAYSVGEAVAKLDRANK